jgi:outer membrane protein OmpA-like peptidoglycan-associated protein
VTGIKTKICALALVLFIPLCVLSQDSVAIRGYGTKQLKNLGNSGVKLGDFIAASRYYEAYMKKKPNDYKTAFQLAECYRTSRDYDNAQIWYEKSYTGSGKTYFLPLFYYAQMLKMNGNCEKAKENFLLFKKQAGTDDKSLELKKQVKPEIAGCDALQSKKLLSKVLITHLDTSINKIHVEAAPVFLNDSNIIYSALRSNKKEFIVPGDSLTGALRKLYTAKRANGVWTYSGEYKGPVFTPGMNIGGGTFVPGGKRFYFTQCRPNNKNKMICAIYVCEYTDGNWSAPVALDKTINLPNFTSSQPAAAMSAKGTETVYFASDRPEGKGGFDIWYFTYNSKTKKYVAPRNAGNKINTSSDEMTPYYDQESRTLYFSSNGWPGMGGMDIFKATGELKSFTSPENLTPAINTSYDDLNYTISTNRETGMLVSNRKGGVSLKNPTCCDDLYEYKRLEFVRLRVAGIIRGGKDTLALMPVSDAKVSVYLVDPADPKNLVFIKSDKTDKDGKYSIPVELGNNYKVVAENSNYFNDEYTVSTAGLTISQSLQHNFILKEIPKEGYLLKKVYYASDKSDLSPEAKTNIDTTLLVLLNQNPELKIEIGSHTDDVGSDKYNVALSQKRADGVVKYLIAKGISADRLTAKGYGKSMPLAPNRNEDGTDNPANREKNRRTEYKVIGKVDIEIKMED